LGRGVAGCVKARKTSGKKVVDSVVAWSGERRGGREEKLEGGDIRGY
jgi:hypothetical protein